MKKAICMLAVAAITFSSVNVFAVVPVQTQQDSTKTSKKHKKDKKMKKDTTQKDSAMKM